VNVESYVTLAIRVNDCGTAELLWSDLSNIVILFLWEILFFIVIVAK